ncbi:MAG: response regulator, partial [Phenylobacterium sp.]|nr:response regulator [Phenylobacterium sp.]
GVGRGEAMGGQVGVRSVPNRGAEFWMEVPLARAQRPARLGGSEEGPAEIQAHVLLVDDHPVNRDLGQAVLGMLGCTSDVARDGYEAVEMARRGGYHAILMDLHMPGMDGLAATRAIRAMEGAAARVPIVAMSADVLPEQLARMYAAGMVDSVEKPINVEKLQACLVRWAGRDSDGAPLASAAA